MEIYKLSPLLLLLLLSACSKPAEKEEAAQSNAADIVDSQPSADVEPDVDAVTKDASDDTVEAAGDDSVSYETVLVETVEGADQVLALNENIQALQALQDSIAEVQASIADEVDDAAKADLVSSLDAAEAEYLAHNKKMLELYGMDYTSSNEYLITPKRAQIFVQLTEEETTQGKINGTIPEEEEVAFAMTKELGDPQLIQEFQQDLNLLDQLRGQIALMSQAIADEVDEEAKGLIEASHQEALDLLKENDRAMFEKYGYTIFRSSRINFVEMDIHSQPILPDLNQIPSVPGDFVLVSTLEGAEMNAEFVRNVQVMEALAGRLSELSQQIEVEEDEVAKAQLQEEFDKLSAQMDENNQSMAELYQYSLSRDYLQVVNKARVLVQISEEEIAKQKAADPEFEVSEDGFAELLVIEGAELNREFRNNVQLIQMLKNQIVKAKAALQEETDADKKAEIESQIEYAMSELLKGNQKMTELYGYSLKRNYEYSVESSQLFLQLTRQEIIALLSKKE